MTNAPNIMTNAPNIKISDHLRQLWRSIHKPGGKRFYRDPLLDSNPAIVMRYCFKMKTLIRYEIKKILLVILD